MLKKDIKRFKSLREKSIGRLTYLIERYKREYKAYQEYNKLLRKHG